MAGKTFVWTVPRDVFDLLNLKASQLANGDISEAELIEVMRSYGFPQEAAAGDHIHIRFAEREVALVNGMRDAHNAMRGPNGKRVLPGIPH